MIYLWKVNIETASFPLGEEKDDWRLLIFSFLYFYSIIIDIYPRRPGSSLRCAISKWLFFVHPNTYKDPESRNCAVPSTTQPRVTRMSNVGLPKNSREMKRELGTNSCPPLSLSRYYVILLSRYSSLSERRIVIAEGLVEMISWFRPFLSKTPSFRRLWRNLFGTENTQSLLFHR